MRDGGLGPVSRVSVWQAGAGQLYSSLLCVVCFLLPDSIWNFTARFDARLSPFAVPGTWKLEFLEVFWIVLVDFPSRVLSFLFLDLLLAVGPAF